MIFEVDEHPVPYTHDGFKQELKDRLDEIPTDHQPDFDNAHREDYIRTITEHGAVEAFTVDYPFGMGDYVYLWHRELEQGVAIARSEGFFHQFKNLMAALVEAEGDCRDADMEDSCTPGPSLGRQMTCKGCGDSWDYA